MNVRRWRQIVPLRLRSVFRRAQADRELDDELRSHLEDKTEHYVAEGMAFPDARRRALLDLGGIEQTKERCRDQRGTRWFHDLAQDARYGLRILGKSPGFTAAAAFTLALGIGANTAMFSVVEAVLLRPLPYPDAERLVLLFNVPLKQPNALASLSYRDFTDIREHNGVFAEVAGNAFHDLTLTGAGDPFIVNTAAVTPQLFSLLGVTPLIGRTLLPADGASGAAPVAVLSEALWRSRFGADASIVGHAVALDMRSFTVVGVVPGTFRYPDGAAPQDVWIPVAQDPLFGPLTRRPGTRVLGGIGRLKPGVSLTQAQADMQTLAARQATQFPTADAGFTIRLQPYRETVVANVRPALLVLLAAVGVVLLIACANIANLLLSRASARRREIAVRIALGAGRLRIVRQLLVESVLLGLVGAVAGVVLAAWGVSSAASALPAELTRIGSIRIDATVLVFALLLAVGTSLAFGIAPALLATSSAWPAMQEGSERAGRSGGHRLRSGLAVVEIALAMVLLVASGLLVRSFALVTSVQPGFDPSSVIEAEVSLPRFLYSTPAQWRAFSNALLERLQSQPGFQESALAAPLPMDRQGAATFPFTVVGHPPVPLGKVPTADYATVSPGYFRVMRIPLLRGRLFSEDDGPVNANVAIISETLAERYFPNEDAVGKHLAFGFPPDTNVSREIVGVVGDVRDVALSRAPGPMMYVPFAQAPLWGGEVVVRSSLSASSIAAGIRQAVAAIDRNLPVTDIEPLADAVGQSVAEERFRTFLMASFGAIALLLAVVGIVGVISYGVSQRTREIGVRMALGAQRRDVLRLVLGSAAALAVGGVVIGLGAATLLTHAMAGLLYGISPTDPVTFASVSVVLLAAALVACYVPAHRAMRVDPVVALRHE